MPIFEVKSLTPLQQKSYLGKRAVDPRYPSQIGKVVRTTQFAAVLEVEDTRWKCPWHLLSVEQ